MTNTLVKSSETLYDFRNLMTMLSLDALPMFLVELRLPLSLASLPGLQAACRDFVLHWVRAHQSEGDEVAQAQTWFEGPSIPDHRNDTPSAGLRQLLDTTQHAIDAALGTERDVFWGWYAQVLGVPGTSLAQALSTAFRQIPSPTEVSKLPGSLAPYNDLLMYVHWLHDGKMSGIERVLDHITAQTMSETDALALEAFWPVIMRRDEADIIHPHIYFEHVAQYWQHLRAMVRLRTLLPQELHPALYNWVATADPHHILDVAEVKAALPHLEP